MRGLTKNSASKDVNFDLLKSYIVDSRNYNLNEREDVDKE